jgi:thymidylate kinase
MNAQDVSITLIGPGGAGKSTVGVLLAERLGMASVDLDRRFGSRAGDIGEYISRFGYHAYARANVETYSELLSVDRSPRVVAQLARPFARSVATEEGVIRERFPIYVGLRARKIETMRPLPDIVEALVMLSRASHRR